MPLFFAPGIWRLNLACWWMRSSVVVPIQMRSTGKDGLLSFIYCTCCESIPNYVSPPSTAWTQRAWGQANHSIPTWLIVYEFFITVNNIIFIFFIYMVEINTWYFVVVSVGRGHVLVPQGSQALQRICGRIFFTSVIWDEWWPANTAQGSETRRREQRRLCVAMRVYCVCAWVWVIHYLVSQVLNELRCLVTYWTGKLLWFFDFV